MSPSALAASLTTRAAPSGFWRSTATERRLRACTANFGSEKRSIDVDLVRSIRITSAPMSPSIMPAIGPGPIPASSMIFSPVSGPI
jgi:hypothetical protein